MFRHKKTDCRKLKTVQKKKGDDKQNEIVFKEHLVFIPMSIASTPISGPVVDQHPVATTNDEPIEDVDPVAPYVNIVVPDVVMNISLRR